MEAARTTRAPEVAGPHTNVVGDAAERRASTCAVLLVAQSWTRGGNCWPGRRTALADTVLPTKYEHLVF